MNRYSILFALLGGFLGCCLLPCKLQAQFAQQGGKLVGSGAVFTADQGTSVSLSADGNIGIVGGSYDSNYTGAVWLFRRSGIVWTQQGSKLVGTGTVGAAGHGTAVAISADGSTVIDGGYADSGLIGASWVFTNSGGVWTQQGNKLVGTPALWSAFQGWSVALSADGNTAIVGGPGDSNNIGAAAVQSVPDK